MEPVTWFVPMADRPDAEAAILAFPHAGGGCAAFVTHAQEMPGWLNLLTLSLPGRQATFGEPLRTELGPLVEELVDACASRSDPYVLFGYCSGALLAYCVASGLQERGAPLPRRLVVGSYVPPDQATGGPLAELDSRELWQALLNSQAIPAELAEYPELWEAMEPVLRADMALVSGYRHESRPPLRMPITVLVGERDGYMTPDRVSGWSKYSSEDCEIRCLPSGHWFMEEDPEGSAAALVEEARAISHNS